MDTFLSAVARDLLERHGTDLSHVTVVFPGKRAGLFLNKALTEQAGSPVWAPRYQTIAELFLAESDYTLADPILTVCELHRLYAACVSNPDPLDRFYGWGEIILSDFDDIDKHLADADRLFSNLEALHEMDDASFLSPEQEAALSRFFQGFSIEGNTRLKEKFLALWNVMPRLYDALNERLRAEGRMYEGALYRDVIRRLEAGEPLRSKAREYLFVGFNVLNDVEEHLFRCLQERGLARFYWDYDEHYTSTAAHFEAGTFIRENLRHFPNAIATGDPAANPPKQVEFVSAASENAQARFVPDWLEAHLTADETETAVVLCNEALLQPVLHTLPDKDAPRPLTHPANITMGFPLTDTPVFSLVSALLALQTDGYNPTTGAFLESHRQAVSGHPYGALLDESLWHVRIEGNLPLIDYLTHILEQLATLYARTEQPDVYQQLYNEALFRTHNVLSRFRMLAADGILTVEAPTLRRLLRTVLAGTTIPFHGEPAIGLQVMGLLETRNLDFRHLLMLSVNEGRLPKNVADSTFIPHSLKEAFGLTTMRHKIAVYAYYFYRLIRRAEHVTFVYNTAAEGGKQGEMSRFLRQLLAETDLPITARVLQSTQEVRPAEAITVAKDEAIMRRLQNLYDCRVPHARPLSPSALNNYLDCPLKFYYNQVAGIRIKRDPADGLDAALFGTLFHHAAQHIYTDLTRQGPTVREADLDTLLQNPEVTLGRYVDNAFAEEFFKQPDGARPTYTGALLVARKVLVSYLRRLLEHDRRQTPFEMLEMEQTHKTVLQVPTPKGTLHIRVGGIVDRIDRVRMLQPETGESVPTLRIVDYKTGGKPQAAASIDTLFEPRADRPGYIFQTFLYALVLSGEQSGPIAPALFFVHKSGSETYSPLISFARAPLTDVRPLLDDFATALQEKLDELFNPDIPFTQTTQEGHCTYCDYRLLCGKG